MDRLKAQMTQKAINMKYYLLQCFGSCCCNYDNQQLQCMLYNFHSMVLIYVLVYDADGINRNIFRKQNCVFPWNQVESKYNKCSDRSTEVLEIMTDRPTDRTSNQWTDIWA